MVGTLRWVVLGVTDVLGEVMGVIKTPPAGCST